MKNKMIPLLILASAVIVLPAHASDSCQKSICGMNTYKVAKEDAQGVIMLGPNGKKIYEDRISIFELTDWSSDSRFGHLLIRKEGDLAKVTGSTLEDYQVTLTFTDRNRTAATLNFPIEESTVSGYFGIKGLKFNQEIRQVSERLGHLPTSYTVSLLHKSATAPIMSLTIPITPLH